MNCLLYIIWNPNPAIFKTGSYAMHWYGICFAFGLVLSMLYCYQLFRQNNIPQKYYEQLVVLCFLGMFFGARLCHCLCYEPEYFLSHPIEIFLPIRQTAGGWTFIGYRGLASHGAGVGLIVAVLCFKWRTGVKILPIMDFISISVPLGGAFIRVGNFMNSEIVGSVTDVPWAVIFPQVDFMPRHPAQLYEAFFYILLFAILALMYRKIKHKNVRPGFYLAAVLIAIPLFRFAIEFVKEVQVPFEEQLTFNMGQLLSAPLLAAGVVIMLCTQLRKKSIGD